MRQYRFTPNSINEVLRKRPYLRVEWCVGVIDAPAHAERQVDGRCKFWGLVPELGNRYLRVVTLTDGLTIHNAFPDRGFKP